MSESKEVPSDVDGASVHRVVRRALEGFEYELMFRRNPSRFEAIVRHPKNPSPSTMPTAAELYSYAEFGVFVVQTNEHQERGRFVIDKSCTAILCHPDDEESLKTELRKLQATKKR